MLTKRKRKKVDKSLSQLNAIAFLSLKILRKGGEERGGQGESYNFVARD